MKAAQISIHPSFFLMKQSNIVSFYHMQMPRWLFAHNKYKALSLESKVAYTFLLNRFQLSKLNGWVNADNEVFVIFTREGLADEMGISYRKAIECFKELVNANLIWEQRLGRGHANRIYLAEVELSEEDASKNDTAPFIRPAKTAYQENAENAGGSMVEDDTPVNQDMQIKHIKDCENGTSRNAETAHQDMQNPHTSNTNLSYTDFSEKDVSQSVARTGTNLGQTDCINLSKILDDCELTVLPSDVAAVFKNTVERLYYAENFKVDGISIPQEKVRSDLALLDGSIVCEAYRKLKKNTDKSIKNSTAYLMAVLYNCIFEISSDLIVDPDLNRMSQSLGGDGLDIDTSSGIHT